MQAMVIEQYGAPDVFVERELDTPTPARGQVRIKESHLQRRSHRDQDCAVTPGQVDPDFPAILNGDVAGVIDAVGEGVTDFSVGDEVLGCAGGVKGWQGALADYMIADTRVIVKRPSLAALTLEECAALPLVFLTAWTALVSRGQIKEGEHVLIHAGTGGVGHVAVQIAKYLGAHVHHHRVQRGQGRSGASSWAPTRSSTIARKRSVTMWHA